MRVPIALLSLALAFPTPAQNCAGTSIGAKPLMDLGSGMYMGYTGGLYLNGSNAMPAAHASSGLAAANAVTPRDASGAPSPSGKIVLLSVGMSNTTQEFSTWIPISSADPQRNAAVVVVDGAQGGQDAVIVTNPKCSGGLTVEGGNPIFRLTNWRAVRFRPARPMMGHRYSDRSRATTCSARLMRLPRSFRGERDWQT